MKCKFVIFAKNPYLLSELGTLNDLQTKASKLNSKQSKSVFLSQHMKDYRQFP